MNIFTPFDPLQAKTAATTEVAALAQKREISNILNSYVGWFDPFSELIQNSLDAIEERIKLEEVDYKPQLWIIVNIQENSLIVTDNGIGLDEQKFVQFLCPDISFKSTGTTRGHKGVGATYLAYGFNFLQVSTKCPGYYAIGKMENARKWLSDKSPAGNPQIIPDKSPYHLAFETIERGVSIYLKFDKSTHPKDLKWIVSSNADQWYKILSIKTGLGAFSPNNKIKVNLDVVDKDGILSSFVHEGIEYFYPHKAVSKSASLKNIVAKEKELFQKKGAGFKMPSSLTNLDAIFEHWSTDDLKDLAAIGHIKFTSEETDTLDAYLPEVYACYVYSTKVWDALNDTLNLRAGLRVFYGGIQIAANDMPQGETYQIPLNRRIGRQNQIHIVVHFRNCSADLGRKGFKSEIVDFAKELSKKISDGPFLKVRYTLRPNTGAAPNLKREKLVSDWKKEMEEYEKTNPMKLVNDYFFLPTSKISLTSEPTREQDVIALFNQLLAGGVIRGIRVMSTNERLTYDGLYRIVIEEPKVHHVYNATNNPLGVDKSVIDEFETPFTTDPNILEYKFCLDALIEDIEDGGKNSNDISLVVVWSTGELYNENYKITSLLDPANLSLREYHGVTHTITNIDTEQKEMDLIVLSELIDFLNTPQLTIQSQIQKYEN